MRLPTARVQPPACLTGRAAGQGVPRPCRGPGTVGHTNQFFHRDFNRDLECQRKTVGLIFDSVERNLKDFSNSVGCYFYVESHTSVFRLHFFNRVVHVGMGPVGIYTHVAQHTHSVLLHTPAHLSDSVDLRGPEPSPTKLFQGCDQVQVPGRDRRGWLRKASSLLSRGRISKAGQQPRAG